jgi:S1-C subfamily serine protease
MPRSRAIRIIETRLLVLCCWLLSAPLAVASSCDKPLAEVFREVSPSVVRIFSVTIDPFSVLNRVKLAVGTGVVIDDEGHIVTNAHVVYGARELLISNGDDKMDPAEIVGADPITDLAVVKLKRRDKQLQKVQMGDSANVEIGEEVMAIGYPFAIGKTATRGIVSAMERIVPISPFSWMTPFIQTDAAINPGNSGGPLVNRCGEVIGINTIEVEKGQNIGFAIPAALVRELLPQLIKNGRVIRAWYGVNGRVVPPQLTYTIGIHPGFLVETIEPGSPAEKIGLQGGTLPVVIGTEQFLLGGDVITSVNGEAISSMDDAARIARSLKVGEKITLEYWRNGRSHMGEVVLPERPVLPGDIRRFHK